MMRETAENLHEQVDNVVRGRGKTRYSALGYLGLTLLAMYAVPAVAGKIGRDFVDISRLEDQIEAAMIDDGFDPESSADVQDARAAEAAVRLHLGDCSLNAVVTISRDGENNVSDVDYRIAAFSNFEVVTRRESNINPLITPSAWEEPAIKRYEFDSRAGMIAVMGDNPCAVVHDI